MKKEDVIIFGASRLGEIAFNILKDKYNIVCFSDNDSSKWGEQFCNIPIIDSAKIMNEFRDFKIIIASMYYGEISVQLKEMGLENIYIFFYADVNDKTNSKKYFVDKMCDLNIYKNLKLDENFKDKYIDNFSLIYMNNNTEITQKELSLDHSRKNVLIFAYYFPPIGGSGVQRTLKYVKYLKDNGWNPIVVTTGESFTSWEKDFSLLNEIPNDVEVIRINHNHCTSEQLNADIAQQMLNVIYGVVDNIEIMNKLLLKIKENNCSERYRLFEPERYVSWVNCVLTYLEMKLNINLIDMVYTTSSPYSDHIIGYYLKKKYRMPWVADFRDEWTNNQNANYFYKDDKFRMKLHKIMEQNIVDYADKVIAVTPISSQNYKDNFKLPYEKVITITNGYDEEDFKNIINYKGLNKKFNILFYGALYHGNDYIFNIIISINQLIEEKLVDKGLIEINIIGKVDLNIINTFNKIDCNGLIKYHGYLPHLECIFEGSKSDLLLMPLSNDDRFIPVFPGKIFEYLRLSKPILAIAPKGSVLERLLKETQAGENFDYEDIDGIKRFIFKYYSNWIMNIDSFVDNKHKIVEYERKNLTSKLANIFDGLIIK